MTPRALLCGRPDLMTKPGGDTRQILALARHLGARISTELRPCLDGVELVHVFNLSRPMEPAVQAQHARRHGKPVICTTIYQDLDEYNRVGRRGPGRWLHRAMGGRDACLETARATFNLATGGPPALRAGAGLWAGALLRRGGAAAALLQARLLESSDLLIFNSPLEEQTVRRCLPAAGRRSAGVVPVGVDPDEVAAPDPRPFLRRYRLEPGFALSVGRFEDLKNQLALTRALRREPVPLVLVGPVNPRHRAYARRVERAAAARPDTHVIHRVERGMLLSAMAAAAVHVLPSWFETAGLASLEAAAARCAVVSTDRGYAHAFLGDDAVYCDPSDDASIRGAVRLALERGPSSRLRERILERYTERRAATMTSELYARVV